MTRLQFLWDGGEYCWRKDTPFFEISNTFFQKKMGK